MNDKLFQRSALTPATTVVTSSMGQEPESCFAERDAREAADGQKQTSTITVTNVPTAGVQLKVC
jgi:hypothetical protein